MIRSTLFLLSILFIGFVQSQLVNVGTSDYNLQSPGDFPTITFGPYNKTVLIQNTVITLLNLQEGYLPDENDPADFTPIVGTSIDFGSGTVNWTSTVQSKSGDDRKFSVQSNAYNNSNGQGQTFSSIQLQVEWDIDDSYFTVNLIVNDYTWQNTSDNTILVFGIGFTANGTSDTLTLNSTTSSLGIAYATFATNATENGSSKDTVPAWIRSTISGTSFNFAFGHFNGSVSEEITVGNTWTDDDSGSGSSFWEWFFIILIALAVVAIIGALVAGAIGFFVYKKKQQQALYDNI